MRQIFTGVSSRPSMSSSFSSDDNDDRDNSSRAGRGPSFMRSSPIHKRTGSSNSGISSEASNIGNDNDYGVGSAMNAGGGGGEKEKGKAKSTHINVVARIRPVEVLVQRKGFFDSERDGPSASKSSSNRRSRLPSPKSKSSALPTLTTPRKPAIPSRNSVATASTASSSANAVGDDDNTTSVVAWEVNEDGDTAVQSEDTTTLIQGRTHSYTLDKIFGATSTTNELYVTSVRPLVRDAMKGYHSSILAYGQTSTGKTFTMTGTNDSPGIIPLSMHELFQQLKCNNTHGGRDFLFRLSYLEVYKEHIRDLLATSPQPIRLFENATTGLVIKGLNEVIVTSPEQIFELLREGEGRRQVGATHMNQHSSRSHVIVRLWIESTDAKSATPSNRKTATTRISSLSLVDLAGSESVRLNGTERREEGQYINKSLMTLGQVVLQLSEQSHANGRYRQHIPYRDSKLTRLLQPSLSGNARMVLLCCISPLATHLEESHNTFKFATRAKKIKQKAVVNTTSASDGNDDATLLQTYRAEIEELKQQLKEARQEAMAVAEKSGAAVAEVTDEEEVHELVEAIQTMERLILKSRPTSGGAGSASLASSDPAQSRSDNDLELLLEGDDNDGKTDGEDMDGSKSPVMKGNSTQLVVEGTELVKTKGMSVSTPQTFPSTPANDDTDTTQDDELHSELHRIRGLLGSVMKKRGLNSMSTPRSGTASVVAERRKIFDFASPVREQEVLSLRKQLKEQEVSQSLRKADSSFLQRQLAEKDQLLEEIAKVLEAVETRQAVLERENATLRNELAVIKKHRP